MYVKKKSIVEAARNKAGFCLVESSGSLHLLEVPWLFLSGANPNACHQYKVV